MKKFLLFFLVITAISLKAQTTFWTEDFGVGCNQLQQANGLNPSSNGSWAVTSQGAEDPQANLWYISATANGGTAGTCAMTCGSNQSLHVGSIANASIFICPTGDCGTFYNAGGGGTNGSTTTNKRIESPVINCTGHSTITLSFKYMENGQGSLDDASLWYNDGTTWAQIDPLAKTATPCAAPTFTPVPGVWTSFSINLPASANNNPNVKIGFLWVNNDDGISIDIPSFAVDSITLTNSNNPIVTITPAPSATVCVTSTLTLNGSATNGPITNYSWTVNPTTGVTFIPNATTPTVGVTFSAAGTYTFNLAATNSSGTGNAVQVITVTPITSTSVTISANPSGAVCPGTIITFTANGANAGTNPNYQWQVNNVNAGTNSSVFVAPILFNNDVVTVTVTPTTGCATIASASYTAQVGNVTPSVIISVSPSATVCTGNVVTFNAITSGGGIAPVFQWKKNGINSGTNSPTYSLIPSNNDQINVIMTSSALCALTPTANSNTITITVLTGGQIVAGLPKTICSGESTKLSSTGTGWSWLPPTDLSCTNCQNPIASPITTTIYTVTATIGSCTSTATQTVVVNQSATALFGTTGLIIPGVPQTINFLNASLNATGYVWDFGDNSGTVVATDPTHIYTAVGSYTVELIAYSANACNDTTYSLLVVTDTAGLSMPNIFTPNGDGINDYFKPNAHGLKTLDCTIYDRWGAKITDLDLSTQQYWDGHTTSGLACSDGTYFYTLKATDVNGKSYSLKGFIQLIR